MPTSTGDDDGLLQCYNKGCGQKFNPESNSEDSCRYHPGSPYFHDAYKIWNCCGRKSTDFSTWLSYPGCATGRHNNSKPEKNETDVKSSPVSTAPTTTIAAEAVPPQREGERLIVWNGLNKPAQRPTDPAERSKQRRTVKLDTEIGDAALKAIHKQKELLAAAVENGAEEELVGAICKNNACKVAYSTLPESAAAAECLHHPGTAIFHEGLKYWSCCEKKTSNFGAFLDQQGCTSGKHVWGRSDKVEALREDWFSRSGFVHLNIYCKGSLPEQSVFETDGLMLRAKLMHSYGTKESLLEMELWGEIIPEESKVILNERKVEIIMKQASLDGWPKLRYEPPAVVEEK